MNQFFSAPLLAFAALLHWEAGGNHMAIVMYIKPDCPYCQQARDHYNSEGIAFTEYDAQNDRQRRREMLAYSDGDPTVPCIIEDGEYVGSGWGTPPRG
jgi:glutaredoxin